MVEPIDPFEGDKFNRFKVALRSSPMNNLGLVETVYRFGECIVAIVTDTSDGQFDARFGQSL